MSGTTDPTTSPSLPGVALTLVGDDPAQLAGTGLIAPSQVRNWLRTPLPFVIHLDRAFAQHLHELDTVHRFQEDLRRKRVAPEQVIGKPMLWTCQDEACSFVGQVVASISALPACEVTTQCPACSKINVWDYASRQMALQDLVEGCK